MNVLIDVGHPGHVHFFKNAAGILEKQGHEILFTVRGKDVTVDLMSTLPFEYRITGKSKNKMTGKALDTIMKDYKTYQAAKKFNPDILLGIHSPYIAHVSRALRKPGIVFTDTELVGYNWIVFPFAKYVVTPRCYRKNHGIKHIRYDGYHEIAYLHPSYFNPQKKLIDDLGLTANDYVVIRLIAWNAYHDRSLNGMDRERLKVLIGRLEKEVDVVISSERELPRELEKYKANIPVSEFHSLIHYASLCISEGSTTAIEAALLGTPSAHIEAMKSVKHNGNGNGKLYPSGSTSGVLRELNEKYSLLNYFATLEQAEPFIERVVANREKCKAKWLGKREKLFSDKTDVSRWMVDLIEKTAY